MFLEEILPVLRHSPDFCDLYRDVWGADVRVCVDEQGVFWLCSEPDENEQWVPTLHDLLADDWDLKEH